MKIELKSFARPHFWTFVILPEIGFFRDYGEYGFEVCWLCWCLQITNK